MKEEGKATAVIGYITLFGWLIAYLMHTRKRTALGAYHLRQSLFLHLVSLLIYILQISVLYAPVPVVGWLFGMLLIFAGIAWLIFWAIGIIFALAGEMRPVPVFGMFVQRMFKKLQ
jgi:uncharacterized membrane protein